MSSWLEPDTARVCLALGMACGTMLFTSIPVLLSRRSYSHHNGVGHILTGLSCLGGGVFLGTCFLHLLPDAVEAMDAVVDKNKKFPVAYALIIAGFVLVLICEQLLHMFNKGDIVELGHSHGQPQDNVGSAPVPDYGAIRRNAALSQNHEHLETMDNTLDDSDDEDRMTTVSMHGDPGSHTAFRAIVLVFALSLHSVFEGIAIGVQKDTQTMTEVFGVIMVHKSVMSITLATSLVSSSTKLKLWAIFAALAVFSAMAPVGILLTLPLKDSPPVVTGVLQCVAAGSFIYITFFEILPHELNSKKTQTSRWFKIVMLLLGIGLIMVLVGYLPDPDHNSSPHNNGTTIAPEMNTTVLG